MREVPVYGWVHGVFVRGVIDEISNATIQLGPKRGRGKRPGRARGVEERPAA